MAGALIAALREARGLVVNTDSDGLLSAVLLARLASIQHRDPLPVVGFYDNERLWLGGGISFDQLHERPRDVLWADADVRISGAAVVSQHVVHHPDVPAIRQPPADVLLINPNYLDAAAWRPYRRKYPFSTAAWVWALHPDGLPSPGPRTAALTGLLWAQDGGHESVAAGRFRENCLEWALEIIQGLPLAPAAGFLRDLTAEDRVGRYRRDDAIVARACEAEEYLRSRLRATHAHNSGWQSQQWCFSMRQRPPLCDPSTDQGRRAIQAFVEAAAELIGQPTATVEPMRLAAQGVWQAVDPRDPGIELSTAFSLARTYQRRIACTVRMRSC